MAYCPPVWYRPADTKENTLIHFHSKDLHDIYIKTFQELEVQYNMWHLMVGKILKSFGWDDKMLKSLSNAAGDSASVVLPTKYQCNNKTQNSASVSSKVLRYRIVSEYGSG